MDEKRTSYQSLCHQIEINDDDFRQNLCVNIVISNLGK